MITSEIGFWHEVMIQIIHKYDFRQNYTAGLILLTNRPGPFFPEWPSRNFADRAILEKMALSAKSKKSGKFKLQNVV